MPFTYQEINTVRGDSKTVAINLADRDSGAVFNPTGWFLIFTVKVRSADEDVEAVIQKSTDLGISVTSASGGIVSVDLVRADTEAMGLRTPYVWDIQAQSLTTAEVKTVARGAIANSDDVTKGAFPAIPVYTTNGAAAATISANTAAAAASAAAAALSAAAAHASEDAAAASAVTAASKAAEATQAAAVAAADAAELAATAAAELAAAAVAAAVSSDASTATTQAGIATAQAVIATEKAGEAADSAGAALSSEQAAAASESAALGYKNTASSKADTATEKAAEAAISASAANSSASSAAGSEASADFSASSATIQSQHAAAYAQSALGAASSALASANSAASSAAVVVGSINNTYRGGLAGASVPATSTLQGDYYRIASAGSSQGKTWATGDIAIYEGTSGHWTQVPAGVVDATELANKVNARAPRQGIVLDGTAGASGTLSSTPSGHLTFDLLIGVPSAVPAASQGLICVGGEYASPQTFASFIEGGSGDLCVQQFSASSGDYRFAQVEGFVTAYAGKVVRVTGTITSGTLAVFVNGTSATLASSTAGTAPAWGATLASGSYFIGKLTVSNYFFSGYLALSAIENRALSASEILALWETGTIPASDIGTSGSVAPSNTNLVGGTFSNFQYDTFSGATSSAFTAAETGGQSCSTTSASGGSFLGRCNVGSLYLVQFTATLTSGAVPACSLEKQGTGASSASYNLTSGANSFVIPITANPFTEESGSGSGQVTFVTNGNTSYAISGLTVTRLGALLAPETNAPGNGYQWKDISGNKADITLPASGVAWALPDRRPNSARGTLSWSGTKELKGLLGQRVLPDGFVFTKITAKATASTTGTGAVVTDGWNAINFVSSVALVANTKKSLTVANDLPNGTDATSHMLGVKPDSNNYTGTIDIEAHYVLTQ